VPGHPGWAGSASPGWASTPTRLHAAWAGMGQVQAGPLRGEPDLGWRGKNLWLGRCTAPPAGPLSR
jgi:hypothetical protein